MPRPWGIGVLSLMAISPIMGLVGRKLVPMLQRQCNPPAGVAGTDRINPVEFLSLFRSTSLSVLPNMGLRILSRLM